MRGNDSTRLESLRAVKKSSLREIAASDLNEYLDVGHLI